MRPRGRDQREALRESHRLPQEWEAAGARFGRDGLLYLAEWRRGFTVHELRALFFECQRVRTLEVELRQAVTDLEAAHRGESQSEARAAWYRRQLVLESRLGAMLGRIAV
jgi:hypothetical protein